jgi:ribosomal-protein-alanine N-acetyltransferase
MEIRPWIYEDNKEISLLENECFSNFWSFQMISDTFTQDNFLGFVAVDNGKIIGFLATVWCIDECEIELIAVKNDYRRQGVASQLLNKAIEKLKELKIIKLFLEVRRSNEVAQSFYEKLGFTYVGVRKNYYGNVEDALIMTKLL